MAQVKRTHKVLPAGYQLALAAGLLSGLTLLAACGDSPTASDNKAAQENSIKAGKLQASAGDDRPSDALITKINNTPISELAGVAKGMDKKIETMRLDGRDAVIANDWKPYLQQRPASEDLKLAADLLSKSAPAGSSASPGFKSTIQIQQGAVANARAQLQLEEMQNNLAQLNVETAEIQTLANRVMFSGNIATVAGERGKTNPPGVAKALAEAKDTLEKAQADDQQKQEAAKTLQYEISSKREQAQKMYDQAQADALKADDAKGPESVDAYKKAMDMKGEADKIAQETAVLQPQSDAAVVDAADSARKVATAQETLQALTASADRLAGRAKGGSEEAAALQKDATDVIKLEREGLTDRVKDFNAKVDVINQSVAVLTKMTGEAASAFKSAKASAASGSDASDRQGLALLQIFQAAADFRAGQAYLIQWAAADMKSGVSQTVAKAYASVPGTADTTPTAPDTTGEEARTQAMTALKNADNEVQAGISSNANSASQWIGYSLKSSIDASLALVSKTDADKDSALRDSKTAAAKALQLNPSLPLADAGAAPAGQ